jgi:hypothetical protein
MERLGYLHQGNDKIAVRIIDKGEPEGMPNHEQVEIGYFPKIKSGTMVLHGPNLDGEGEIFNQDLTELARQPEEGGFCAVTLLGPKHEQFVAYIATASI